MTGKQERLRELEERLEAGFARIGEAMSDGLEVRNWEALWVTLLREYEQLCDELASAKPEQAEMSLGVRREAA